MQNKIQHHQTVKYIIWRLAQFALLFLLVLLLTGEKMKFLVPLFAMPYGVYTLWRILSWVFIKFSYEEKHINIKQGILFTKTNLIEYKNIQNVDITAGPLMRIIGVARVSFWTSSNKIFMKNGNGETQAEEIIYLTRNNAEFLKEYISKQVEKN